MELVAWKVEFEAAAVPDKSNWMQNYMRNQFSFLGIQTDRRRELCKALFQQLKKTGQVDWTFVQWCWEQAFREYQYVANDYLRMMQKHLTPDDLPRIREMIITKSWWDSVDGLHPIVGALVLKYPQLGSEMLEWSIDENMWLRRVAIDHQLGLRKKTDLARFGQILINNLGSHEFFINKAIGWSLRDYSKTDPAWVWAFIERHEQRLSALSIREAKKYQTAKGYT